MKIFSYHTYHSSGIGGVETLLRHIKKDISEKSFDFIEVYHGIMGSAQYPESQFKSDIKLSGYSLGYNFLGSVWRKLSLLRFFWLTSFDRGDVLLLSHPMNLYFIPPWARKKLKIVLIQINRADIYLTQVNLKAVDKYSDDINHIVVYTDTDRQDIENIAPALSGKCVIIPRGCKLATASPRQGNRKRLVTIARIEEKQKNFAALVKVLDLLPESYSLDIYGDGPDEELQHLHSLIENNPRIRFCGVTKDVAQTLKAYDVFVMTSNYEGFGQTLIEARSQGLPVVLFNSFSAAGWIVQNNLNGYLVEHGDVNAFKASIESACEPMTYNRLSSGAIDCAYTTDRSIVNSKWCDLVLGENK